LLLRCFTSQNILFFILGNFIVIFYSVITQINFRYIKRPISSNYQTINHYGGPRNQQNRTTRPILLFHANVFAPFNLPAPGRRQTLYVVFDLAEPCVFSKQSLEPLYCNICKASWREATDQRCTPSPEVTGSFCLVPKHGVSLAP